MRNPKTDLAPGAWDSCRFSAETSQGLTLTTAGFPSERRRRLKPALLGATAFVFFVLPSAFGLRSWAQSYSINWSTVASGGGTSTGGAFRLRGTVGQPAAGAAMRGGEFSLTGGFWAGNGPSAPPGSQDTLQNGAVNTGTITADHPQDRWTFTAKAGDNITLRFGSTDFEGQMELFGPDGVSLGLSTGADAAIPNAAQPTYAVPQSGVYVVAISGFQGGTGAYRLSFAQPSQPWTLAPAPLANGGINNGTLTLGALDRWGFTAQAGDNITVRFGSSDFQCRMELFAPNGTSLGLTGGADASIPSASQATFTVQQSGAYTVMVSSYSGSSTGSYRLSFAQPSQPWDNAPLPLANGGVKEKTLALGGLDQWSFTANAGETVFVRCASADFQSRMELFGPDGDSLALAFGLDAVIPEGGRPVFTATKSGAYTVMVSSYSGKSTGSYRINLAQPSQPWQVPPVPLANGGANDGALALSGLDRWSFAAKAGETILLRFASTNFLGRLDLFGPDGALLSDGQGGDIAIRNPVNLPLALTNSGVFTAVVSSYGGGGTGAYHLSFIQPSQPWSVPPRLMLNGNNPGTLGLGEMDPWQFTACAGDNFTVQLDTAKDFLVILNLFGSDGRLVGTAADPGEVVLPVAASSCGTFVVVAESYWPSAVGAYQIAVSGQSDTLRLGLPQIAGSQVSLAGAGGTPDTVFVLLTTTNLGATPVVWTPVYTNRFDAFGTFSTTAKFDPLLPRYFLLHMLGPSN